MIYKFPKATDIHKLSAKRLRTLFKDGFVDTRDWYPTKKVDGSTVIITVRDGRVVRMESSLGTEVRSMDHIRGLDWSFFEDAYLVGEAYIPGEDYATSGGAFRGHTTNPSLHVAIFDGYSTGTVGGVGAAADPWIDRIGVIRGAIQGMGPLVRLAPVAFETQVVWALGDLFGEAGAAVGPDCDGIVLHDIHAPWEEGRTVSAIKIKPGIEVTAPVIRVDVTQGEKTGRPVYTLIVLYKGRHVGVASGVPHELPPELARYLEPGGFKGTHTLVDVKAMAETEGGSLREPRFKGIRADKVQPD